MIHKWNYVPECLEIPAELEVYRNKILKEIGKDELMVQKLVNNNPRKLKLERLRNPDYVIKKAFLNLRFLILKR